MGVFKSIANGARRLIGFGRKTDSGSDQQEEPMSDDPLDILLDPVAADSAAGREHVALTPGDVGDLADVTTAEPVVIEPPLPPPAASPSPALPPPLPPPPVAVTMTVTPAPAKPVADETFMARFERVERITLGLSPEKIRAAVGQIVKGAVDEAIKHIARESVRVGDELRESAKPLIEKAVSDATQAANDRLDRFLRWFGAPESAQ